MPRIAKPKVELITSLPSDPVSRQRLKATVAKMVSIQRQIADLKEDLKEERDIEKSSYNISPKFLNSLVKREYDVQYGAEKKTAALEAEQEVFTEADILMGRGKPANVEQTEEDDGAEDGE